MSDQLIETVALDDIINQPQSVAIRLYDSNGLINEILFKDNSEAEKPITVAELFPEGIIPSTDTIYRFVSIEEGYHSDGSQEPYVVNEESFFTIKDNSGLEQL